VRLRAADTYLLLPLRDGSNTYKHLNLKGLFGVL
jgi:hypothetical protein